VIQGPEASPVITVKAYKVNLKRIQQDSPSVYNSNLSSTTESDEDAMHQATLNQLNQAANYHARYAKDTILPNHHLAGRWRQGGVQPFLGIEMKSRKTRD
jgi:hypothetical protein